jgi:FHS family L-fucose permease-like MFS transporter
MKTRFAFGLVTTLFFMFGFITCLNDILVPHLKALFDLDYARASLVQFCFFGAYFLVSLPAGKLVGRLGYKGGAVAGLLLTGLGCCLFYPAAEFRSYPLFLLGLFVLASGVTIIQVAVNPYIAMLGPKETSSVRLNLAQAFNSLGTTLAPMLGAWLILEGAVKTVSELAQMPEADVTAYRAVQASSVQVPYLGLALVLVLLALLMGFTRLPKFKVAETTSLLALEGVLTNRRLMLGALAIFCYVGAEVAIGSYLINFLGLSEVWAIPAAVAGTYVSMYWGGAMIGRFIGSAVLKKIAPTRLLSFNASVAAILVLVAMIATGSVSAWSIIAVGLFNSIMFPTIFTLAIDGLEDKTPQGSAVLCMAIVGGAIIPLAQGFIADRTGLHVSLVLPVACYAFIAAYGRMAGGQRA